MIQATLLKSAVIAGCGQESGITTWMLTYPRFIHAEFMTHRMFSRNAASSRAIPISKMIRAVIDDPAMPVYWGRNRKGMQAKEEHTGIMRWLSIKAWLALRWPAVAGAWLLDKLQLHKQLANRILEPWSHITVIMTTGHAGLMNMFALRDHPDAQPEFQCLAAIMLPIYINAGFGSQTQTLHPGDYYIPMVSDQELGSYLTNGKIEELVSIACGRMARVSYLTHDGQSSVEADKTLSDRLEMSEPMHASPFEHVAIADPGGDGSKCGNLPRCWIQHRKRLSRESTPHIEPDKLLSMADGRHLSPWVNTLIRRKSEGGVDNHGRLFTRIP